MGLDRASMAAMVGEISLCYVQRRRWAADEDQAVEKNKRRLQSKVGAISSLLVCYHCRSSVGRWSYGAAAAAMVGAISLVLCVVILVVTTVPPKIQSAPPPISRSCGSCHACSTSSSTSNSCGSNDGCGLLQKPTAVLAAQHLHTAYYTLSLSAYEK